MPIPWARGSTGPMVVLFRSVATLGVFIVEVPAPDAAKTFESREEVVLQDGGMIVLSWWVRLVPGQPFGYVEREKEALRLLWGDREGGKR